MRHMALDDKKVLKLVVTQVRNQIRVCSLEFSKMVASLANDKLSGTHYLFQLDANGVLNADQGFPGVLVLRAPRKGSGPSIYAAEIHQLMSGDLSVDRLLQRSID